MQAQEIFDIVARHLFTQGCRSMNSENCAYRGDNGLKCAVGVLIPDEIYDERMDFYNGAGGTGVGYLIRNFEKKLPDWFKENFYLLKSLQDVHDMRINWIVTSSMRKALSEVASQFGLDDSILNSLELGPRIGWRL